MRLPIITALSAAALALSACAQSGDAEKPLGGTTTGNKTFGDLPFWEGDVCVEIRPDGKRTIVPATKCPAKN